MPHMADKDILNASQQAIEDGRQWNQMFEEDRRKAISFYLGRPFGDERDGKSKAVLSDVADTIEWYMPGIMKMFTSGKNIVTFQPQNADDEARADQENRYCDHVLWDQNNGFDLLYAWFKDGLQLKNGIIKVWWMDEDHQELERYTGLTSQELKQLRANDNVKILEADPTRFLINDPETGDPSAEDRFNVRLHRFTDRNRVKIVGVPVEEFYVSRNTRNIDLDDSDFCNHRYDVTRSRLIEQGFDKDQVMKLSGTRPQDVLNPHRHRGGRAGSSGFGSRQTSFGVDVTDPTMVRVTVDELYIRMDADGDGVAELLQVFISDNQILSWEEWPGTMPFVAITPVPLSHEFYGRSLADMVMDLQYIRSQTIRQMMDNMHRTNTVRVEIPDAIAGKDTIDDWLNDTTGGVVRTEGMGGLRPIDTPVTWMHGQSVLAFLGEEENKRVGLNAFNMGMVPDTAESGRTAAGSMAFRKAANQRIDVVGRIFGEGVRRLYLKIHENARLYQDTETILKLNGQYVPIDPSNWRERTQAVARVGMGAMDVEEQVAALQQQFQILMAYASHQNPAIQALAQPANFFALNKEILEVSSIMAPDRFVTTADEAAQITQQQQRQAQEAQQQQMQQQAQMQQQLMQMQAQVQVMQDQAKEQAKAEAEAQRIKIQTQSDLVEGDAEHDERMVENQQKHEQKLIEDRQRLDTQEEIAGLQAGVQLSAVREKETTDG